MGSGTVRTREGGAGARWALAVLVLVYAVNFIDRNILTILLQPIQDELGVSDFAMGLLTGPAFAVFYTLSGIPIARLADRGSRRGVMAVGIAFWSLMTAACGLAQGYAQLFLARVGVGVGEASATPSAHSLISDLFPPERRTRALAIYNSGASLGIFFGLAFGGWLQQEIGWRGAFFAVGLPGLAIALLVRFGVPEPTRGQTEGRSDPGVLPGLGETFRTLAALPSFRHLCMAAGLYGLSTYALTSWAATFLLRVHDLSYVEVGLQLGLCMGLGGAFGAIASGALCDRLARQDVRWQAWLPACAGLALIPAVFRFAWSPGAGMALAAFAIVSVLNVVFAAPTYALVQSLSPLRMRALGAAIVLFVLNLVGLGIGPPLLGGLTDLLDPRYGSDAIRISICLVAGVNVWAAAHSGWAARHIPGDLERMAAEA